MKTIFDDFYLSYRVLAKGSFIQTDSEYETLLIALSWRIQDAFGSGQSLLVLEKMGDYSVRVTPIMALVF